MENPKSSLPLTTLNPRKPNVRQKCISHLANSCFYNYKPSPHILRQHRVLRNLRKNKDIVITKSGVIILDRKIYNSAIEKIISDTSKFEKLSEDPALKREASL